MILWLTLAELGCGLLGACWLLARRDVGDGLLRFLAVTAAVALAPLAAAAPGAAAPFALAAALGAGLGGLLLSWGASAAGAALTRAAIFPAAMGLALAVLPYRRPVANHVVQTWLLSLDAFTSAALLGLTVGAMILGHWYLVNTDLPIRPLRQFSVAVGAAAGVKACMLAAVLFVLGWPPAPAGLMVTLLLPPGLFYVIRVAFGIAGPLAMAPMVWHTARLQATQSATGILYAAVFLVLVGEMTANFLLTHTPFPF